jgi:3',5'-cyclic AMP phosphodiesterase CpdA
MGFRSVPIVLLLVILGTVGAGCRVGTGSGSSSAGFSFAQLCDPQLGFTDYAGDLRRFQLAVEQINRLGPDFVVVCGDLVNEAAPASYADFKVAAAGLRVPLHVAPGNHDVGNMPSEGTLRNYRKLVGRDYFSFVHEGTVFVVVNAQSWKAPLAGETEQQDLWLTRILDRASRQGKPIYIISHYPLFLNEPDEPDEYFNLPREKRKQLLGLFERAGVVAVLAGHTHKTGIREWRGIQFVESGATSKNFDAVPPGFRVWHVDRARPVRHEYISLPSPPP